MSSYTLSRIGIIFIWLYHGLVPKLLFRDPTELALVELGPTLHSAETTVLIAGAIEVVLGLVVLIYWSQRWPVWLSVLLFTALLIGGVALKPSGAVEAFNPVTLSGSAILFGLINLRESSVCGRTKHDSVQR
ncbi:MAG: hypothetical protein ACI87E_001760 [Mariniblastus sp.]|jgi:hypothetical protein